MSEMEQEQSMKILAVDDEPVFLDILKQNLKQIGYDQVVYCQSAFQALRVLQDDPGGYDCLLVDIKMPEMDGIELVRQVRKIPQCSSTPILMLTGMSESQYVDASFMAGASDYINKPLNRVALSARLRSAHALGLERKRVAVLSSLQMTGQGAAAHLRFSDAAQLPDIKGSLELVALKNYALTLGNLRMLNWRATGFAVVGASEFFSACGPSQYMDMMQDVGSVLFDVLKRGRFMLAHAGSGCFVALIGRDQWSDIDDLESQANALIDPFNDLYQAFSTTSVRLVVGTPQQNRLLSFQRADRPIDMALHSARQRSADAPQFDQPDYPVTHA